MPFTPAHSAIVLPLINRKYFSATALIIGSVAPDFEYFFKMSVESYHSHSLYGLFYFNLPVVFLLAGIFHGIVKKNLLANSPLFIQKRFYNTLLFDLSSYLKRHPFIFAYSALLGAATHIVWDNFTHGAGYFARNLWFYKGTYVPFDGVNYPLFYALQHISTAVGLLIVVAYVIFKKKYSNSICYKPQWQYWFTLTALIAITVGCRFYIFPNDYQLGNVVVTVISGLCLGLIICGLIRFPREVSSRFQS
jgi:hypothetical protein